MPSYPLTSHASLVPRATLGVAQALLVPTALAAGRHTEDPRPEDLARVAIVDLFVGLLGPFAELSYQEANRGAYLARLPGGARGPCVPFVTNLLSTPHYSVFVMQVSEPPIRLGRDRYAALRLFSQCVVARGAGRLSLDVMFPAGTHSPDRGVAFDDTSDGKRLRPEWDNSNDCHYCNVQFTTMRRRHHW